MWYYKSIDDADPPEDDRFLEIEPSYELFVGDDVVLMGMQKREPKNEDSSLWVAQVNFYSSINDLHFLSKSSSSQDGNGGLWSVDLNMHDVQKAPEKLFSCHAGPILDIDLADWGAFIASCGQDHRLHIYNHKEKELVMVHKFAEACTKILWFPCEVKQQ